MGRPSNPRLMARVLEAVKHLGEGKGSSARQVLDLVRQGNNARTRNLAMQVHRALKNAVTAGLLQLRSGRYKMLISLRTVDNERPGGNGSASKTSAKCSSAGKKKEDLEAATHSTSPQEPLDAGPKSRCSHCKKHKRRSSRRRRKRSSTTKRRRRPTKQAKERNSRKLRRQGDEEVSNRRERRKQGQLPGSRSQGEVPKSQRSERPGKSQNPETNRDSKTRASELARNRAESSSDTEGEEAAPEMKKTAPARPVGRKKSSSSRRRVSKPRRSSRKRNSSTRRNASKHGGSNHAAENDSQEDRMECCDTEDGNQGQVPVAEDVCNDCGRNNRGSGTSI